MCFGIHISGFDLNKQISNSLTTCHPVRFQETLSLRTGGKDDVMMLFYLHSQSNEHAFENMRTASVLIFLLSMCRPSVQACISMHIFLAHDSVI